MQDMRVMILSKCLTGGGAERVAAGLASQLKAAGIPVWLVVLESAGGTYPTTAEVIDLQCGWKDTTLEKLLWYGRVLGKVCKLKKDLGITHCISFLNQPDLLNVLTVGRGKAIVSVRNNMSSLNKNAFTKAKDTFIFRRADRIVALSQGAKEDLERFYGIDGSKIDVIYNACDVETIQERSREAVEPELAELFLEGKTVITAGRLTRQKGQWHMIRAFRRVAEEVPESRLLILGQGEKEDYLKQLTRDCSLSGRVHFLGYQKNPYAFLTKGDIFVFSSLFEGFGNILLEAMACGLPIVSTDCVVGPRELLEPGTGYDALTKEIFHAENGILVPVCDGTEYTAEAPLTREENCLAEALIGLLRDPEKREAYRDRSQIRIRDFSADEITAQWIRSLKCS